LTDIARIETVKRDPGVRVVAKIAKGLGVPTSELFEGVEKPQDAGSPRTSMSSPQTGPSQSSGAGDLALPS
jgi:transcriptional regulator with XRE-family HTH domain